MFAGQWAQRIDEEGRAVASATVMSSVRGLNIFQAYANQYLVNFRAVGTSFCDGVVDSW